MYLCSVDEWEEDGGKGNFYVKDTWKLKKKKMYVWGKIISFFWERNMCHLLPKKEIISINLKMSYYHRLYHALRVGKIKC